MGSDHFRYDRYHRLLESQMGSLSPSQSQTTTFDGYGNMTAMTTNGTGVNFPTSGLTNRLTSAAYDAGGNTTSWNGNSYSWDLFNRMTHWSNGSEGWSYVYTADDERLWSIQDVAGAGHTNWTIRGFGNQVLTRDERRPASPSADRRRRLRASARRHRREPTSSATTSRPATRARGARRGRAARGW
ncbi:MAG: hypothetical protein R2862_02930 [Thermoanaerobaculia bacterium]